MFTRWLSAIFTQMLLLTLLLPLAACVGQQGGRTTVAPAGEYATINTAPALALMKRLHSTSAETRDAAIREVLAKPQSVMPTVLYALSAALFAKGEKDDAAFWFYAGQLRARYDANRCADVSARQAVAVLNQNYGPPINQYAFQDIPKLKTLIPMVVEWEEKTPHDYDHRWINLHGMGAMMRSFSDDKAPHPLSLPEADWPHIGQETREAYLRGFNEAMEQMEARAAATPASQPAAN
ncbi:MAG TPA: hypothetical protein VE028_10900 [Nitratidesulfovibrio sp.]|nr:hypothetical protein [Nitratidesulfovibrio sp.]